MRLILTILIATLSLIGNSQIIYLVNKDTVSNTGQIIDFSKVITGLTSPVIDSTLIYYITLLNSNYNSFDSLDYISTGVTVNSHVGNKVVLSASTSTIVGMACRFGTGTTNYTVVSIGASADTVYLDKSFTDSDADELKAGAIEFVEDMSIYDNNAIQTTDAREPVVLWCTTDSARLYFDGSDDRMVITHNANQQIVDTCTWVFGLEVNDARANRRLIAKVGASPVDGYEIFVNNLRLYVRFYRAGGLYEEQYKDVVEQNVFHEYAIEKAGNTITWYVDDVAIDTYTMTNAYVQSTGDIRLPISYANTAPTTCRIHYYKFYLGAPKKN